MTLLGALRACAIDPAAHRATETDMTATRIHEHQVRAAFGNTARVAHYRHQVEHVGLWASERVVLDRDLVRARPILDLGCGSGRVALGVVAAGHEAVSGLDLTPELVKVARQVADARGHQVDFRVGNAKALPYDDATFGTVIFAFNGLMQVPGRAARRVALAEIARVLEPGGVFVFTTHDRAKGSPEQLDFWAAERARWADGTQNPRLHDLGDIVFESSGMEQFIHIPSRAEIMADLASAGLAFEADLWRPEIADEPPAVVETSKPCRFWVARR